MKAQGFKSIREYQKLNHFPGTFQIGRKDRLWRNLSRLQVESAIAIAYPKSSIGIVKQTFKVASLKELAKQ